MGWGGDELTRSRAEGKCTATLAAWVLSVVDRSLRGVYGPNYSDRCLQASECVRLILARLGIRCNVWKGAMCAVAIKPGAPAWIGWSGFWDKDHHIWVATEFAEFIDLTISQLHIHPTTAREALPIPALWWRPLDQWPPLFRYLHEAQITIQLPPDEMRDLDQVLATASELVEKEFHLSAPPPPTVAPILMGIDSLNDLDRAGWPWLVACRMVLRDFPPLPEWVRLRERELMEQFQLRNPGR